MKLREHMPALTILRDEFLAMHGAAVNDVTTGRDAWTVAHRAGITRYCYDLSRDVTDAHIQTALEVLFPRAEFKDAKRY